MARDLMLLGGCYGDRLPMGPGIHGQSVDSQVNKVKPQGCGKTRLCIETRTLFTSILHDTRMSPSSLDVTLSGHSTGYIALGLTRMTSEFPAVVFVCAQNNKNNGEFFFNSMLSDREGILTPVKQDVNKIRGAVDGNMITCEFSIPIDDMDNMMMDTMLHVLLGSGTVNGKRLGIMKTHLDSGAIDVTDPASA